MIQINLCGSIPIQNAEVLGVEPHKGKGVPVPQCKN